MASEWTRERQARRARREQEFGATIAATNAFRFDPVYGVIQTDDLHHSSVPAAKDCVLFLWVGLTDLPEAFRAMAAWGFKYKAQCVWAKPQADPPDPTADLLFRCKHMLIFVGVRGRIPAPAPGTQFSTVVEAENGREAVARMIQAMFPSVPRLDLWSVSEEAEDGIDAGSPCTVLHATQALLGDQGR